MRNRLHDYICIFILLEILHSSISFAKVINGTCRTKRQISVVEASQPKENSNYANEIQEINLEREEKSDNDLKEDDTYLKEKHKISKRSVNPINTDFQLSNAEKSVDYKNIAADHEEQSSNEESDDTGETDEEISDLVRLPRDVNAGLDRYTDQDERSNLYDDYEAKDVAKRGIPGVPEDYEELQDDSPEMEDVAAMQEEGLTINEAEKRETRSDTRVKRDQAVSETLDKSKSNVNNLAKPENSKIAEQDPYSRQVSRVDSSKSFNEASASKDVSKIKESESNEGISKFSGSSKIKEPINVVAPSKENELKAEYEKRVQREIQRKIDSIKEEIQRDIEAQQRIKDIEDNNAKFDELQDQEREDEESFMREPIEKRQTVAKRSIREIADTLLSPKKSDKKRSLKEGQHRKLQRRSSEIGKLNASKEDKHVKRFVTNHDVVISGQTPSKGLGKKKRERVRQTFLVNNDHHRTHKRHSRSYMSDQTGARSENELFRNQDLNSYFHTDDRMLQAPSPVAGEDENNEGEQNRASAEPNSLVSLTGGSQELSPRLEKEYKEAFGGLQSEPGSALARFKRIKRILGDSDSKI